MRATTDRGGPSAKNAGKDRTNAKPIGATARGENCGSSLSRPDVAHFDDLGVTDPQLPGGLDMLGERRDRLEPRFCPPLLDLANGERVDRHRILAREKGGVMNREV